MRVRTVDDLGTLARAARISRGWSQQQAADQAGVSRRFVNMFEGGGHRNAEVWRALALLGALGVEVVGTVPPAASDGQGHAQAQVAAPAPPDGFDLHGHLASFRKQDE